MNKKLFAIGDIHGCFDSLKELVENKIQLQKDDKLILLGDFIDRGDKSKEVIDFIMDLQKAGFDVVLLMGNHEAMLLDAYENEKNISRWIQNGGNKTLKSFEIDTVNEIEPKYIQFFKSLRYYYAFENYLFVHAGFNDEMKNPFKDDYHMLWKCREKYNHTVFKDKVIVHGHCTTTLTNSKKKVRNNENVINLDTGCVYADINGYGRLTALELNSRTIHFV